MRKSSQNRYAYQLKYSDKSLLVRYSNNQFFSAISRLLSRIPFHSILDAGCGEGVVLRHVCNQFQPNGAIAGVDLDMKRVQSAMNNLKQPDTNEPDLMVGNLQDIPFQTHSFDLTICLETLEHVGEPELALAEIARVTRHYALISVPNEPWWRIGNMARGKYWKSFGNTPGHINHWTTKQFHRLVGRYFTIVESASPVLWNFVLCKK